MPKKILVLNTAFIGDIVLTLPLVQCLRRANPKAHISFLTVPAAAGILQNHPDVQEIIPYDKKGEAAGLGAFLSLTGSVRRGNFELVVTPHRSLRSAALGWLARIPRRIGFSTSAAPWLFTDVVPYDRGRHEIDRNLSLLQPLGISPRGGELPALYPGPDDERVVDRLLLLEEARNPVFRDGNLLGFAPGSVWNTKRWPRDHFVALGKMLTAEGSAVLLLGGREDVELCTRIEQMIGGNNVVNAAGKLTLLQSAELIRRCSVVVSNDSAPMHLAVGVGTPVVALFGATVPGFGFAPRGKHDAVAELGDLACRPCSVHGGEKCPIGTFACMQELKPEGVYNKVHAVLDAVKHEVR